MTRSRRSKNKDNEDDKESENENEKNSNKLENEKDNDPSKIKENEENEENEENKSKEGSSGNDDGKEDSKKTNSFDKDAIKEFDDNEMDNEIPKDKDIINNNDDDNNSTITSSTTTTTNTLTTKSNNKKLKVEKTKKPKVRKPKKTIEDSFKEIEPSEAANYTLSELIKTRIIGETMKSTLEREKAQKQNQNSILRHQRNLLKQPQNSQQQQQQQQQQDDVMNYGNSDNSTAVEFVNGLLTIKAQTNEIDQSIEDAPVLYESTDHITNFSFSKRTPSRRWSQAETREFLTALKKYGTDFSVLENVFPNRDRRQLKSKFKREQKDNPNLLNDILQDKIDYDMDEFIQKRDEVSKQKKEREEKMNLKNDLMKLASENADQDEDDEDELYDSKRNGVYGNGVLGSGRSKSSNAGKYQEEVVMDSQQYEEKQQQQQQQTQDYDPYSMENDQYYTNDYDY